MIIKINANNPNKEVISDVVDVLKKGGVIVYPTDTIYGLGCDIYNKKALERIYQIKKREKKQQFSFICNDFSQIGEYAIVSNEVFRLMKRVLPGAFTFILTASLKAPKEIIEKKRKTVGIRIPDNNLCLEIVNKLGNPIVTTSVNLAGHDAMCDPIVIDQEFGKMVDIILDAGVLVSEPSTIVDATSSDLHIIRQGKGIL